MSIVRIRPDKSHPFAVHSLRGGWTFQISRGKSFAIGLLDRSMTLCGGIGEIDRDFRTLVSYLRRIGINCFNLLRDVSLAVAARGMNKELARRDSERGGNNLRWFTPDEVGVVEALARIIVPSDEETPGIDEVCVLGPPAIEVLDNLVAKSSHRQHLYSRGLLSFDLWAVKRNKSKFAEMRREDQIMLLSAAQQVYDNMTGEATRVRRVWHKLRVITQARGGPFFAAQLYPQIRNDCLQVFYTSRVSWVWLEYDGPPMDKGYPSLVHPR